MEKVNAGVGVSSRFLNEIVVALKEKIAALKQSRCLNIWEKINKDLPTLNKDIAKGEMGELREWLRKNIHRHGRRYGAGELCKKVTGKPLSAEPLLRHLSAKARDVYGVEGV